MKTRTLAAMIAAVITLLSICSALPAAALSEKDAAYNAEDVALLRDFFETEDAEGVKIGEKLNPGVYDPDDPETWSFVEEYTNDFDGSLYSITHGISWEEIDGELRATEINLDHYQTDICGHLAIPGCAYLHKVGCYCNSLTSIDLSACPGLTELNVGYNELTELDISRCGKLKDLWAWNNHFTEIDLSGCPELRHLSCGDNMIERLDFSGCPKLTQIHCDSNKLSKLDVSCCPDLTVLDCHYNDLRELDLAGHTELVELHASGNLLANVDLSGCTNLRNLDLYPYRNRLSELDLSENPELDFDHVTAEGNGYIGHYSFYDPDDGYTDILFAIANEGEDFDGWYDENDVCISTNYTLDKTVTDCRNVTARFTGTAIVYGDSNGDGAVTAADALLVLRSVMDIEGDSSSLSAGADIDGNGVIDAADAILILRMALGLE